MNNQKQVILLQAGPVVVILHCRLRSAEVGAPSCGLARVALAGDEVALWGSWTACMSEFCVYA